MPRVSWDMCPVLYPSLSSSISSVSFYDVFFAFRDVNITIVYVICYKRLDSFSVLQGSIKQKPEAQYQQFYCIHMTWSVHDIIYMLWYINDYLKHKEVQNGSINHFQRPSPVAGTQVCSVARKTDLCSELSDTSAKMSRWLARCSTKKFSQHFWENVCVIFGAHNNYNKDIQQSLHRFHFSGWNTGLCYMCTIWCNSKASVVAVL